MVENFLCVERYPGFAELALGSWSLKDQFQSTEVCTKAECVFIVESNHLVFLA